MFKHAKKIGITALAFSLIYGAKKLIGLNSFNENLVINTKFQKPSAGLKGLSLPIEVTVRNPTKHEVTIIKPFVRLQYTPDLKETPIMSSVPTSEEIKIAAFDQQIFTFNLESDYLTIGFSAKDIFSKLKGDGLELYAISIVNMKTKGGLIQVPVEPTHFTFKG